MGGRSFFSRGREGRIYGRGACDDKGPLAAMLIALSTLGEVNPEPRSSWPQALTRSSARKEREQLLSQVFHMMQL
ncbi:M20/M25/M40 family metallo-hydrolase [Mesorhizobium sp. M0340]|uniref:M20/M25/M40 family metallo-hydrolase n=1 Tax=Mesorhizobium sp. M0340 TaxID=2956939 RepID=UPI0033375A0D